MSHSTFEEKSGIRNCLSTCNRLRLVSFLEQYAAYRYCRMANPRRTCDEWHSPGHNETQSADRKSREQFRIKKPDQPSAFRLSSILLQLCSPPLVPSSGSVPRRLAWRRYTRSPQDAFYCDHYRAKSSQPTASLRLPRIATDDSFKRHSSIPPPSIRTLSNSIPTINPHILSLIHI